ncbi:MAG: hypothetical protein Q7R81_05405 [Candidatus Peregrinibacteria bacterium]|nr:hypothetical protein [Candidatus Peregrinibacteria bacterium]
MERVEEAETTPESAWRGPVREPMPRVVVVAFVVRKFVERSVVAKKLVVVAAVPVAFKNVKFWRVEDDVARKDGAVKMSDAKVRFAESVNTPAAAINGMRVALSDETVRLVVEAVPKYPVPDTEIAVEEAYGRIEAIEEVATK